MWLLRAVSGVEPEAVPRRVLGEDVPAWGGDRLGVILCGNRAGRRSLIPHVGIHSLGISGMGGPLGGASLHAALRWRRLYSTWVDRDESASKKDERC